MALVETALWVDHVRGLDPCRKPTADHALKLSAHLIQLRVEDAEGIRLHVGTARECSSQVVLHPIAAEARTRPKAWSQFAQITPQRRDQRRRCKARLAVHVAGCQRGGAVWTQVLLHGASVSNAVDEDQREQQCAVRRVLPHARARVDGGARREEDVVRGRNLKTCA